MRFDEIGLAHQQMADGVHPDGNTVILVAAADASDGRAP
jgi:hypothetical protein